MGVSCSDYATLLRDCGEVQPAVFLSMSGFWVQMFSAFHDDLRRAAGKWLGAVDEAAIDIVALAALHALEHPRVSDIRERVVARYRTILGTRIRAVATGGSPTPERVLAFMREVFESAKVVNSYGTTEVPGIANDGVLNPDVEFRLVDAPEVGYTTADSPLPRGEIVVRSKHMATSYWGTSEAAVKATRENFRDGWYYTADIGEFDPASKKLKVIDRRSNLAELYVDGRSAWIPIEPVEAAYRSSPLIENIYLHSDRDWPVLIALVVPAGEPNERTVKGEIQRIAKENEFDKLRIPGAIIFADSKWSAATGELSSTGKIVRGVLKKRYENAFAEKYAILEKESQTDTTFDWGTYRFSAASENDAARLNEAYEQLWGFTLQYRTLLAAFSQRMRELENAKRTEIENLRTSRASLLQGDRTEAAQQLTELKAQFTRLYSELNELQNQNDPEVDAIQEKWRKGITDLVSLCAEYEVKCPWQISSGTFLLPPSAEGANALPPQGGLPNWRVVCEGCGYEIEWGSRGSGNARWKDVDDANRTFCPDCYLVLKDSLTSGIFVQEFTHPIWIHDAILQKSRLKGRVPDINLAVFITLTLESYPERPCIFENDRWLTFREVADISGPVGTAVQKFRSVGFTGVINSWLVIAAVGVLRAGVSVVSADEAEFVFASEHSLSRPHLIVTQESLREFSAGQSAVVPPSAPANTAITALINVRYNPCVVVTAVGAIEASPIVIGAVLQGPFNCGGRLVFMKGGGDAVEVLRRFRPTTVLLSPVEARQLKDVKDLATIGGRVRVSAVVGGEVDTDLVDHLNVLFKRRIKFSIEELPREDEDL